MVLRYLVGLEEFNQSQLVAADVTIDGIVTALDAKYYWRIYSRIDRLNQAIYKSDNFGSGEFQIQTIHLTLDRNYLFLYLF